MLVLGIESTAHTFGIGIVDTQKKEVLFNEKVVYQDEHSGMDPRKLSEFHIANFQDVVIKARDFLESYSLSFSSLSLISFSQGPGQGNALKVGGLVAKTLSLNHGVPIVGVNHIKSHLEIGKMHTGFEDPVFLNITGVNSQVVSRDVSGVYRVYGETEDIGLGNLLDSVARLFDLGFPGGPVIEERASRVSWDTEGAMAEDSGGAESQSCHLQNIPYTIKGMNVSFAGLNSNIAQKKQSFENGKPIDMFNGEKKIYHDYEEFVNDLCFSLQEVVFAMIQEVAERALAYTCKKELVLVGGVASNKRFIEMTTKMCESRGIVYDSLPLSLCMDNGAMIAWAGFVKYEERKVDLEDTGTQTSSPNISGLKPMPYVTVESQL